MPCAAAAIAIDVAAQDASPARNSQPGVTRSPLPPSSAGMSVAICVPFAWLDDDARAALPARGRRRVVVQAHLGPALQDRLHPLHCRGDVLACVMRCVLRVVSLRL